MAEIVVDVWLYGAMARYGGSEAGPGYARCSLALPEGSTIADLLAHLSAPTEARGLTFINGQLSAMPGLQPDLAHPLADGDRVLAVIRGTAANQDGHTENIGSPSRPAQVAAYRAALAAADVDPGTVGMVEAHGTGTPVGDPIEYTKIGRAHV